MAPNPFEVATKSSLAEARIDEPLLRRRLNVLSIPDLTEIAGDIAFVDAENPGPDAVPDRGAGCDRHRFQHLECLRLIEFGMAIEHRQEFGGAANTIAGSPLWNVKVEAQTTKDDDARRSFIEAHAMTPALVKEIGLEKSFGDIHPCPRTQRPAGELTVVPHAIAA